MRHFWRVVLPFILISCSSDGTNRNPYLQEVNFRYEINLNLPLYSDLNTIGNPVYISNNGVGTRGAFVIKSGLDSFYAFEASCPNHAPNNCSTMSIDGQNVVCDCEGYIYNLLSGQLLDRPSDGKRYYDLLFYNTTRSGNVVIISN